MGTGDSEAVWSGRAVLHVDMDAFFAAVEQLDHPEWRGLPLVVGGTPEGRGVISAASYEAREYGVRSAMSAATAKSLLPAHAIWARGDHRRYAEVSATVRAILESFTPYVEQASIDEAYLDVTPGSLRAEDPVSIARAIIDRVDSLGLSCSVGVATSKVVAKIASDRDKPHGLTVVAPGGEAAFLAPLPVRSLPGIGPVAASALARHGIRFLGQVAALDDAAASALLGSWGPGLVRRARGEDPSPVRAGSAPRSVSREKTFPEDIRTEAAVAKALAGVCSSLARRLVRKGVSGRTLTVKIRYADLSTRTVSRTARAPVHREGELRALAAEALRSAWTPGVGLRLIGVGVSNLEPVTEQLDLLSNAVPEADEMLAKSIDRIRERFGEHALDVGFPEADG